MKKRRIVVLTILLFLCLLLVNFVNYLAAPSVSSTIITDRPVYISETKYNPANNMQNHASVIMAPYNNKLVVYYLQNHPNIDGDKRITLDSFCVVENGAVQPLLEHPRTVRWIVSDWVYSLVYLDETDESVLYCYNLSTQEERVLIRENGSLLGTTTSAFCLVGDNGMFFIPVPQEISGVANLYYWVQDGLLHGTTTNLTQYPMCNTTYRLTEMDHSIDVSYCSDGNWIPLEDQLSSGQKELVPVKQGLLVYNQGTGSNLLYLISSPFGEIVELFTDPDSDFSCTSAFNVYQDYAFLSVNRYDRALNVEWPGIDPFEGTFRIDLNSYSVEKISDKIYNGLYIFDDSGIFACDQDGSIYKLDFDGNVIMTILENRQNTRGGCP